MLIDEGLILLDEEATSKEEIIEKIADLLEAGGKLADKEGYIQAVRQREKEMSTNLGDGIGIPHAKTAAVREAGLVFIHLKKEVEWRSEIDGEAEGTVSAVFGIGVPESGDDQHLRILAQLARHLIYEDFRDSLLKAEDKKALLEIIREATKGAVS